MLDIKLVKRFFFILGESHFQALKDLANRFHDSTYKIAACKLCEIQYLKGIFPHTGPVSGFSFFFERVNHEEKWRKIYSLPLLNAPPFLPLQLHVSSPQWYPKAGSQSPGELTFYPYH